MDDIFQYAHSTYQTELRELGEGIRRDICQELRNFLDQLPTSISSAKGQNSGPPAPPAFAPAAPLEDKPATMNSLRHSARASRQEDEDLISDFTCKDTMVESLLASKNRRHGSGDTVASLGEYNSPQAPVGNTAPGPPTGTPELLTSRVNSVRPSAWLNRALTRELTHSSSTASLKSIRETRNSSMDTCVSEASSGDTPKISSISRLKSRWNTVGSKASSSPSSPMRSNPRFRTGMLRISEASDGVVMEGSGRFRDLASNLVASPKFNSFIGLVIVVNAFSIGAQAEHAVSHLDEVNEPIGLRVLDFIFCTIFTAELAVRLYVFRLSFFISRNWKFNIFDLSLVTMQLVEETLEVFSAGDAFGWVSILRVLRIARVLRLVRVVHLFRELRTMIGSIFNSVKSLFWTVLLLFLMIYVVAVCITQIVTFYASENPDILAVDSDLHEHFSSIYLAVLSLFGSITGGIDWQSVTKPLLDKIGWPVVFLYSLYICFAVFAMLNVVTGIFVESALQGAKADKDANLATDVRDAFRLEDGMDAVFCKDDLVHYLDDQACLDKLKEMSMTAHEMMELFQLIDVDEAGSIPADEFVYGCLRLHGPPKAIDVATLMYTLQRISRMWETVIPAPGDAPSKDSCGVSSLNNSAFDKDSAGVASLNNGAFSKANKQSIDSGRHTRLASGASGLNSMDLERFGQPGAVW